MNDKMLIRLPIQELTTEIFAPFGEVIEQPVRPFDGNGPGWKWWGGVSVLPGEAKSYAIGYLDLQPEVEWRFDWAERHQFSPELLVPTGGKCLIHVAPPDYPDELDRLPSLDRFQVFQVHPGQAVLLRPGVWHGAPLALDQAMKVVVLLYEDTGSENTSVVQFADGVIEAVKAS
jgi:ureidoglycolate hydrolase